MSRIERLLAGRGFAVFTQSQAFAADTITSYLRADPEVRHVVLVHHLDGVTPLLAGAIAAEGPEVLSVHWSRCGDPDHVAAVAAIPSSGLVFVSLDHHRTVGNRLDPRRRYIRRKEARKKIVIDAVPYENEAWRVFFPFAFFDRDFLGYHHSYALEQDYGRFLDGDLEQNPCEPARIADLTWRGAVVDAPRFSSRPAVTTLQACAEDHAAYPAIRDALFDGEKTISSVKRKLARWIQERYPSRSIRTDMRDVYADAPPPVVATDLPFDRWLLAEQVGLMNHTDALLRAYIEHQREAGE